MLWVRLPAGRPLPGHEGPGDAGHLVREGNRNLEPGIPAQEPLDPAVGLYLLGAQEGGLCANDQQAANVAVTLVRDPAQALFAACRVLPRY